MKIVAKAILIDNNGNYLLMRRSDHPTFPNDPDLPGGTLEIGEEPLQAMLREVEEEAGIILDASRLEKKYEGTQYSGHGTEYHLYEARLDTRPEVTISWEHSSYEWMSFNEFLAQADKAVDTYMYMVSEVIRSANR